MLWKKKFQQQECSYEDKTNVALKAECLKRQGETTLIVESKSESLWCFREERGVTGRLLLNKPWPLSIRPEELIRHETGQTQVRNEGHWVTKQAASIQEGQHFIQPKVSVLCLTNSLPHGLAQSAGFLSCRQTDTHINCRLPLLTPPPIARGLRLLWNQNIAQKLTLSDRRHPLLNIQPFHLTC